ncbi:hypothetical protein L914_18743 [Phytophthora nicotianae]|uniref:RxLR effector protein n=2 Tax=Phytophthora nicotianae TaxID=4792 RepID=V9E459_PHYNI|nr:hypothetical protein F443_19503 [Phytophthora nicotianae P1569]ETM34104.1 hypothetical protein L914_18743 [Phytophthora nicotianae]
MESNDAGDEERGLNLRFRIWKLMGKRPGDIYQKFFHKMSADKIRKSSKHNVWKEYANWFDKSKKSATITA